MEVIEGTWEEVKLHEAELAGRRVRVIVEPELEASEEMNGKSVRMKPEANNRPKQLKGYGMFAHLPGGSEAFALEKQQEIAREDRKFE